MTLTINIKCFTCGDELQEQGALVFTPPNEFDECEKIHLCNRCWELSYEYYFKKMRIANISNRNKSQVTVTTTATAEGKTKLQSFVDMLNDRISKAELHAKSKKAEDVGFLYGLKQAQHIYEESTK